MIDLNCLITDEKLENGAERHLLLPALFIFIL